jgi:hypothetical protein
LLGSAQSAMMGIVYLLSFRGFVVG